jgi:lysophospholipase L1-like esterase
LKEVFDYELNDYKSNLEGLDANVKLQGLFIVFTVLLILRRSDSLNLFGNQLPMQWLHLFAPLVMLYLWLNFGFLLHALILQRLEGIKTLIQFSPSTADLGKSLFRDSGFIDGWFLSFVDTNNDNGIGNYSGIVHNSGASTVIFLVVVLGTLVSAAHACLIAITFIGCRRYWRQPSRRFLPLYYGLPILPLVLLAASHYRFAYEGPNKNWIQLYIAFTTIPLVGLLLWLAVSVDKEVDPASVRCLRRRRRLTCLGPPSRTIQSADSAEGSGTIALIGDSLSTGFYVGSLPGMLSRMWRAWKGTWFVDAPGGPGTRSVFERLCEITPISAVLHATPRSQVDAGGRHSFTDLITNAWHLSQQVDEVLAGEFPDLLLLWIGHNNMDWRSRVEKLMDEDCEALSAEFIECYERQMRRLIRGAAVGKKPTVIIVYGLINFASFFQARGEAERRRRMDPTKYPYLEKDYDYFASMKPEHRGGMIRLAEFYNKSLKDMCGKLGEEIRQSDVRLVYSDALSKTEIGGADMLNESDAWHPSRAGHRILADSAYEAIKEQLRYLGWERDS